MPTAAFLLPNVCLWSSHSAQLIRGRAGVSVCDLLLNALISVSLPLKRHVSINIVFFFSLFLFAGKQRVDDEPVHAVLVCIYLYSCLRFMEGRAIGTGKGMMHNTYNSSWLAEFELAKKKHKAKTQPRKRIQLWLVRFILPSRARALSQKKG